MTAMRKIACEAPERAEARFRSCCVRCHVLGTALLSALLVLPFAAWAQPAGQPASVPGAGWQTRTVQPGTTGETALQVTATLTENGPAIEQGLLWHVFQRPADGASQPTLVAQSKDASARFRLEPGDYLVNVAFGRAHLTRRISLQAGQSNLERFVLNAGGLKINAIPPFPGLHAERSIVYDVFSEERDQAGNRTRVLTGGRLDRIVRLNAGLYQVVASYGDANARVRAELAVEAGKLTEATLSFSAARITFRLVNQAGGDALPEVAWTILDEKGALVKESAGAVPTHVLAVGRYVVIARRRGQAYRAEFVAADGDNAAVEVVAR